MGQDVPCRHHGRWSPDTIHKGGVSQYLWVCACCCRVWWTLCSLWEVCCFWGTEFHWLEFTLQFSRSLASKFPLLANSAVFVEELWMFISYQLTILSFIPTLCSISSAASHIPCSSWRRVSKSWVSLLMRLLTTLGVEGFEDWFFSFWSQAGEDASVWYGRLGHFCIHYT